MPRAPQGGSSEGAEGVVAALPKPRAGAVVCRDFHSQDEVILVNSKRQFLARGLSAIVPFSIRRWTIGGFLPLVNACNSGGEAGAEAAVVVPIVPVVPAPSPEVSGVLQFAGVYTMRAAPNDSPQSATVPFFGKHQSWAYSPVEKAAYIFGGDGGSDKRITNSSHGWHYGRLHLDSTPPLFDHFYPFLGIAGKVCPAGADCVPWVYDSKRNCFWQIGGFQWGITNEGWIGIPRSRGVWRFNPATVGFGEWIHVSPVDVPGSASEGMSAFYYPRLDMVIGLYDRRAWWYRCSDDSRGTVAVPMADGRDVGSYCAPGYDAAKDELLFVTPINGKVVAASLANFPTSVTTREVASVPTPGSAIHPDWSQLGAFPSLFIPLRRQFVLFYIDRIKIANVDTGVVTDGPAYRSQGAYINEAVYAPDLDAIVGTYKDSADVAVLKWSGGVDWLPPSGRVIGVGKNLLQGIDPDPTNVAVYRGRGNFGAIIGAWGGSAYASELGALGSILIHNGGDADYWGNQICRFDFSTLTWSRLSEPYSGMLGGSGYSNDPGYDHVKGLHAVGQPSVPHDYDSLQYIPPTSAHPEGILANVVRLYCYGPRSPVNSSYFDIATKRWSVADTATQRNIGTLNSVNSIHDPSRGRIWYRGDGNIDRVGYVDTATFDHGVVRIPGTLAQTYATSARDPKRDLWLSLGKIDDSGHMRFSGADLSNMAAGFTNIALTGDPLPLWDAGFDWCPALDCGFGYFSSDPQAVYRFTPAALAVPWTVTRIIMGGTTITGRSLPFSKWRWASKLGAFYLLTEYNQPVWVYRP
jgi:hypothetical protein